jgi:hypothetical protein
MKKWVAALAILAVALAVAFLFSKTKTAPAVSSPDKLAAEARVMAGALAKRNTNTVAIIESNFARVQPARGSLDSAAGPIAPTPPGRPSPRQFTNIEPAIVLENMSRAIRQYGEMFGGNPVGTNPEITSQLSGHNPRRINFLNAQAGMCVNEIGELVDPWGTPYFFHQLSGAVTEVRSAGPDKEMWTSDDLVVK